MTSWTDWIIGLLSAIIPALAGPEAPVYNGYLEADYVYVAPLTAGRIASITVEEGQKVQPGAPLIRLEDSTQKAALQAAEAGVALAEANLDNLQTGGREAEIAVIRASLRKAEADRALARANAARSQQLLERGEISTARADQDKAALESAEAQVDQLSAQLNVARLPARDAQRVAAEAALDVARAQAEQARIALADRALNAPVAGIIDRLFYDAGEVAATGAPILSILQPDALKVIFFLPEADRSAFAVGALLSMSCDGCAEGMQVRVTRLAAEPQYTPPILYSRDERGRLVFRAEAALLTPTALLPGQPISLRPEND